MLVLLGQNNHGKSNIIGALNFALNSSVKPDITERFAFAEQDDKEIYVEISFDRLTEQEKTTWKKYVREENGSFCFRKTATFDDKGKATVVYNGYLSEPTEEWLQAGNAGNYTNRNVVSKTPLIEYVRDKGRISKSDIEQAQKRYIEEHRANLEFLNALETTPLLGSGNVAAGLLPELFLIPAVRELGDESKVKSTALFGKLITRVVTEMASADPQFQDVEERLRRLCGVLNAGEDNDNRPHHLADLESSIEKELPGWDVGVSVEVTPPDMLKLFELGTNIHLDDGLKTLAERKGHGLQRAVIFGLMKAWAAAKHRAARVAKDSKSSRARSASESVVFAIEEPEIFLHPHAQRALDTALRELADVDNNQVFVCSHSTHFVDLDKYRGIVLIRKTSAEEGTSVVQCEEDLFEGDTNSDRKKRFNMAAWVNPDRGEMFFARRVAFVEGQTEKVVFPYLAKKLGCYKEDVSVIECGSKNNIRLYVAIANAFQLNYIVVHDEDGSSDPTNENEEMKKAIGDSGSLKVLQPDFEGCSGVPEGKPKPLVALDYFLILTAESLQSWVM